MKKVRVLWILLASLVVSANVCAEEKTQVVYIQSAKFATPLLQKWVNEYSKLHPQMQITITEDRNNKADIHVSIVKKEGESSSAVAVGRYAILPIAGKNNVLHSDLQKKKLNGKRLKELYFEKDILDDDYEPEKDKYNATVYAGSHHYSVTATFANHFGFEARSLKGKKIAGDDIYLNHAVQKDNTGVSFNNLNYVFDVESRKLKEGIALLLLDIKKEYNEILAESNLDKTLELLESKKIDLIPVAELALEAEDKNNPAIQQFLQWVRSEGQTYNHDFGFLNVDDKKLAQH
jgi:ABC-type phosphate transport system substrate-binding protein